MHKSITETAAAAAIPAEALQALSDAEPIITELGINTPIRAAYFLGLCAYSSSNFRTITRNLYYKKLYQLLYTYPQITKTCAQNNIDPASLLRNTHALLSVLSGLHPDKDQLGLSTSLKYRPRGYIPLTGSAEYGAAADLLGINLAAYGTGIGIKDFGPLQAWYASAAKIRITKHNNVSLLAYMDNNKPAALINALHLSCTPGTLLLPAANYLHIMTRSLPSFSAGDSDLKIAYFRHLLDKNKIRHSNRQNNAQYFDADLHAAVGVVNRTIGVEHYNIHPQTWLALLDSEALCKL